MGVLFQQIEQNLQTIQTDSEELQLEDMTGSRAVVFGEDEEQTLNSSIALLLAQEGRFQQDLTKLFMAQIIIDLEAFHEKA